MKAHKLCKQKDVMQLKNEHLLPLNRSASLRVLCIADPLATSDSLFPFIAKSLAVVSSTKVAPLI